MTIHLALAVGDIDASVTDYAQRLGVVLTL